MTLEASVSHSHTVSVGGSYDGKIAGLYDLEETLGSGHFAVVKLARHVFTGAKVAVKVVDKTKLDEVSKAHLFQEVRCMKLVQHPNVVRLYEVIDTQTKLYLVLELGDGGDLYDYIMKHETGLSEDLARKYFRQILRAITYCHQLHVVHRDLKPENVVFFEKLGIVKLTDFGFSNKFSPGQKLETFCGSLAYSAPEILLGDSYDAPAVDIWSLGVILYMLVCGQPPFEKANDSETLTMIMDCKYTMPAHVTQSCRHLIASMLVRDPKKRATLEQIAKDAWLREKSEPDTCEHLPLVSRQQLSEEDHAFIIQKMINGNIASKEEIMHALDKNKYNHITATYFLLAEMRLRKRREDNAQKQRLVYGATSKIADDVRQDTSSKAKQNENTKVVVPISINVSPATPIGADSKTDKRNRKCSIVREEDEEESGNEYSIEGNELKVVVNRRESTSDGRLNRSVQERSVSPLPAVPTHSRTKIVVSVDATLSNKVDQIDKHPMMVCNTKEEDDALGGLKELEIGKLKPLPSNSKNPVFHHHRRTKMNKIRTPSCSSSEASDDDTKTRNKKKINKFVGDTPVRFRMHRRDSHDDSSDSQDQLYPPSGSHNTTNIISNNSSGESGKKENQVKDQNKTEETRKSHSHKNKKQNKDYGEKHAQSGKQSLLVDNSRRRRIRESQSLDRITEAQEYELRYRCYTVEPQFEQRNSLFNLNAFSVAETKEEYDEEFDVVPNELSMVQVKNSMNIAKATHQLKHYNNNSNSNSNKQTPKDIYNLNSIEEIDLILDDKSLTKAIQITGSKCFVTIKKIRRLGKYFPIVNFS